MAADFAEKSWLLARRPWSPPVFRPRHTCFLWAGSPCMLNATMLVGEYVRGVVMTEDWESVRYV